jgi:hypothetical protein
MKKISNSIIFAAFYFLLGTGFFLYYEFYLEHSPILTLGTAVLFCFCLLRSDKYVIIHEINKLSDDIKEIKKARWNHDFFY